MNTQTYSMLKSLAWLKFESRAVDGYHSGESVMQHHQLQELIRDHQDAPPVDFIVALSEGAIANDLAFDLLRAILAMLLPNTDLDIELAANPGRIDQAGIAEHVSAIPEDSVLNALMEDAAARERAHHRVNQRANALEI